MFMSDHGFCVFACTIAGTATITTSQLCECGEVAEDHVSSHSASLRSNSQQTARGG